MDRRMYRRDYGTSSRGSSRQNPVSSDVLCGNTSEDVCDRGSACESDFDRYPLGMCYVPWQHFRNLYENEFVAMAHGTLFKELDLEFYGRSCK